MRDGYGFHQMTAQYLDEGKKKGAAQRGFGAR